MFLYFVPNKASELFVPIPLDRLKLEFQVFVFKTTMINNVTKILPISLLSPIHLHGYKMTN
jgi:hypothetical protein